MENINEVQEKIMSTFTINYIRSSSDGFRGVREESVLYVLALSARDSAYVIILINTNY